MCCCEAPGQERVRHCGTYTDPKEERKRRYITCPVPWVSSKDLSTHHECHLNSPSGTCHSTGSSWDRARTSTDHGAPCHTSATTMGRQGRKASSFVALHNHKGKGQSKEGSSCLSQSGVTYAHSAEERNLPWMT